VLRTVVDIALLLLLGGALLGLALGLMVLSDKRDRAHLAGLWQQWLESIPAPSRNYIGRHRGSA
jgi:hypothetical protein